MPKHRSDAADARDPELVSEEFRCKNNGNYTFQQVNKEYGDSQKLGTSDIKSVHRADVAAPGNTDVESRFPSNQKIGCWERTDEVTEQEAEDVLGQISKPCEFLIRQSQNTKIRPNIQGIGRDERLASPSENEYILLASACVHSTNHHSRTHPAMTKANLRLLLADFKRGKVSEQKLMDALSSLDSESLGFATVDHHRELRQGFPEVIFCQGKTPKQVAEIASRIATRSQPLLATRATPEHAKALRKKIKSAVYHEEARVITANDSAARKGAGTILVISAGTSDLPVAEEAAITARMLGNTVDTLYDVGVAGIHRLLSRGDKLSRAHVIIVVAGMEGALPSVVGGLVDVPVIAVPTSIGYGASFGGVAALLAMLNSCASGITVVNIDNGFGAGFAASLMNKR